ncbi:MAG: restriction endonuclease [Lachnospiraceae bacterium]|nr:restriction endonuclease [Lachnospiraceae bacterium]
MKWIGKILLGIVRIAFTLLRYLIPAGILLYFLDWFLEDITWRAPIGLLGVILWFLLLHALPRLIRRLRLHFMDGYQFEAYCCKRLRRNGFRDVHTTTGSRDHGADILARKGLHKYVFQCKLYQYPVGNKAVQQAFTAMNYYDCDRAIVIANQRFTSQAELEAEKLDVELWDKDILLDL